MHPVVSNAYRVRLCLVLGPCLRCCRPSVGECFPGWPRGRDGKPLMRRQPTMQWWPPASGSPHALCTPLAPAFQVCSAHCFVL